MALTEKQLILLDNLIYLNDSVINGESDVKEIVNDLLDKEKNEFEEFQKAITDNQFYYCGNMVNGMNAEEWKNVLTAIKNDDYLMNISQKHLSPFR